MLALLLNEEVKQMSMGALNQINLDLLQCERKLHMKSKQKSLSWFFFLEYAASEPVKGLQEDAFLSYFVKLREILDLFISWDWPTYFHDYGKETNKYKKVDPETAIILLEK